jgi:CBS domain-containing protein
VKRNENIQTIMTANPMTVQVGEPLSKAYGMLLENTFHHVPVIDGRKLVGMISSSDIGRVTYSFETDQRTNAAVLDSTRSVRDVMHQDLTSLPTTATVRDAANVLANGQFHAVPIIENDELVGIVTSTDVIRYLAEQY